MERTWTLVVVLVVLGIWALPSFDHWTDWHELHEEASMHFKEGRDPRALLPLAKKALRVAERQFGPDDHRTGRSANNLALVYLALGEYSEAEPLFLRAGAVFEKASPPDPEYLTGTLNNLGLLYQAQSRYDLAEDVFQRVLEVRETTFGADHSSVARISMNLALLHHTQGQYSEAEPFFQRALAINEKRLESGDLEAAWALSSYGASLRVQNRFSEAEPLLLRALAIYKRAFGPDRPGTSEIVAELTALYRATDREAEAEVLEVSSQIADVPTPKPVELISFEALVSGHVKLVEGSESPRFDSEGRGWFYLECESWQGGWTLEIHPHDDYMDDYESFSTRFGFRESVDGVRYAERIDIEYESADSDWQHVYIERLEDGRFFGWVTSKDGVENEEPPREIELPTEIKFVVAVMKDTLEVANRGGRSLKVITVDSNEDSLAVSADITVSPYDGPSLSERYQELWQVDTRYYRLNGEVDPYARAVTVVTPEGIELLAAYEDASALVSLEMKARPTPPRGCSTQEAYTNGST